MRSLKEIAFRLRQEARNLRMWAFPPCLPEGCVPPCRLPKAPPAPPASAVEIRDLAGQIRQHRFPLLGLVLDAGPGIRWRRDYVNGMETDARYFRRIPYLNPKIAGDHKIIWEMNRHHHLVVLAQAGDEDSRRELETEIESWLEQNPFQRGINWASGLEVAFRALSWTRVYHLAGDRMPQPFRRRFLEGLYRHGCHLEANLSYYFSPNTHLLGEAVALHALGTLFPDFPGARRWASTGGDVVTAEMGHQVCADGSHFERSSYYHLYALDMFLLHARLTDPPPAYRAGLARMADYLEALVGPDRVLSFLGDDDGGRLFHPYGARRHFARDTLTQADAFLGRSQPAPESRLFPDAGIAVLRHGDRCILVDAGPFGPGSAGHSHSDTLSIVARAGGRAVLIDPGTYTYVGEPALREWFRGSAAHNTVRIANREQAVPAGPFGWTNPPRVRLLDWRSTPEMDLVEAECAYAGFAHRRRVEFRKPDRVSVTDDITGPPGVHDVQQFWHLGSEDARSCLDIEDGELGQAWRSDVFGEKHLGPVLTVHRRTALPCRLHAGIRLSGHES